MTPLFRPVTTQQAMSDLHALPLRLTCIQLSASRGAEHQRRRAEASRQLGWWRTFRTLNHLSTRRKS